VSKGGERRIRHSANQSEEILPSPAEGSNQREERDLICTQPPLLPREGGARGDGGGRGGGGGGRGAPFFQLMSG